jgi:GNAT superfamily N-acetyltransferase
MTEPSLIIREIDLERDGDLCVGFRADSYVCGEGSADRFWAGAGPVGREYLSRLARYMRDLPGSCVHAWHDGQIVGQIEMVRDGSDPAAGKVNLFYLRPDYRGRGLGRQLERYAVEFFRACGFGMAWLRVSPTNGRAIAFYKKNGWVDGGPDPRAPQMHVMRKRLWSEDDRG